jgi:hypothetical protein
LNIHNRGAWAGSASRQSDAIHGGYSADVDANADDEATINSKRFAQIAHISEMDIQMGFPPFSHGTRLGWMVNMQTVLADGNYVIPRLTLYCFLGRH